MGVSTTPPSKLTASRYLAIPLSSLARAHLGTLTHRTEHALGSRHTRRDLLAVFGGLEAEETDRFVEPFKLGRFDLLEPEPFGTSQVRYLRRNDDLPRPG